MRCMTCSVESDVPLTMTIIVTVLNVMKSPGTVYDVGGGAIVKWGGI